MDPFDEGSFRKLKQIGKGSYGDVFLVQCGKQYCVLKEVYRASGNRPLGQEYTTQQQMKHPHILKCIAGKEVNCEHYNLFLELAIYGDLRNLVRFYGCVERPAALLYYHQILAALRHLHDMFYCHRDIKPANILVFGPTAVKLADFGSTLKMNDGLKTTSAGTREYQPPEMKRLTNGVRWDLWSAAVVYAYCLLGKDPWDQASFACEEYKAFQEGDLVKLIEIDARWQGAIKEFDYLRSLLNHDPEKRLIPEEYGPMRN